MYSPVQWEYNKKKKVKKKVKTRNFETASENIGKTLEGTGI
jgi:hypothetical protein